MRKIKNFVKNNKNLVILSLILLGSIFIIYKDFITYKKLYVYIDVGSDTYNQYLPMYKYLIGSIKSGDLSFWSFNIGIGASTLSLTSMLLDPFNIILIFIPIKNITYGIIIATVLKIYLCGILFYFYLNKIKITGYSAIIGSVLWAFNGYSILWGQHYQFLTFMFYFTLLMYSVERFFKDNKRILLILSIAIASMQSPYFMFMATIYIILYATYVYIYFNKFNFRGYLIWMARNAGNYLLGIGLCAVLFVPQVYILINSPRVGSSYPTPNVLWASEYICAHITRIFSNNIMGTTNYIGPWNYYEIMILSSSAITILLCPQIVYMVKERKQKKLIIASGILIIIGIISPIISWIFNDLNAVTTRWSFLIIFTLIINISTVLNFIIKNNFLNKKLFKIQCYGSIIILGIAIVGVLLKSSVNFSKKTTVFIILQYIWIIAIILILMEVINLFIKSKKTIYLILILIVVVGEVTANSYVTVNLRQTLKPDYIYNHEGYYDNCNEIIRKLKENDKSNYRIDKTFYSGWLDDSLFQNYNGIKSYNGLNNPSYLEFVNGLNGKLLDNHPNYIAGFDGRENILSLLGVKYVLSKNKLCSDNYILKDKSNDIYIYKNKNSRPLAFTYDSYVNKDEFQKMSIEDKENILLNSVVLNYDSDKVAKGNLTNVEYNEINNYKFDMKNVELIKRDENKEIIYKAINDDPNIIMDFEKDNLCDITIYMDIKSSSNTKGKIYYKSNDNEFNEMDSIDFHVKEGKNSYKLKINAHNMEKIRVDIGKTNEVVEIQNIKMYKQIKNELDTKYDELNIKRFENCNIEGNIFTNQDKILFFSIPYDKGWKVKIDGKEVETLKINIGFLGIDLPKGNHNIEVTYVPQGLKLGMCITSMSFIIIVIILILNLKNKKTLNGI